MIDTTTHGNIWQVSRVAMLATCLSKADADKLTADPSKKYRQTKR